MQRMIDALQAFLDLGATVILRVVFSYSVCCLGKNPANSLCAGLTIGVAFVGIFLIVDLLVNNLGPAAHGMVKRFGVELSVIDVGWPAAASISWASPIAAIVLPLGLALNVIMLVTRTTKTMNVDIWKFWHFSFKVGANCYAVTWKYHSGVDRGTPIRNHLFRKIAVAGSHA